MNSFDLIICSLWLRLHTWECRLCFLPPVRISFAPVHWFWCWSVVRFQRTICWHWQAPDWCSCALIVFSWYWWDVPCSRCFLSWSFIVFSELLLISFRVSECALWLVWVCLWVVGCVVRLLPVGNRVIAVGGWWLIAIACIVRVVRWVVEWVRFISLAPVRLGWVFSIVWWWVVDAMIAVLFIDAFIFYYFTYAPKIISVLSWVVVWVFCSFIAPSWPSSPPLTPVPVGLHCAFCWAIASSCTWSPARIVSSPISEFFIFYSTIYFFAGTTNIALRVFDIFFQVIGFFVATIDLFVGVLKFFRIVILAERIRCWVSII